MFIGQTLHSNTNTTGDTYYSPWFPRGGNLMVSSCEVIALNGSVSSLKIQVQTKNEEDSDKDKIDVMATPATITLTAGTITTFNAGASLDSGSQGLQDLVRFCYTLVPTTDADCWIHFRMLNPAWLSN